MAKDKLSKPITDSRFSSVHSDPRFKLPKFNKVKVKVDDRFSRKELEKLNGGSGKKTKVDRFGRPKEDESSKFDKYFRESDSESETEVPRKKTAKSESEASESESESESDSGSEQTLVNSLDKARGEGNESSEESSSDSESESDSDVEVEVQAEESDIELDEGKPEEGDPSDTFAVVNMDWDNIRAVDLMATFLSFVPKSGLIKSVTVFPSEFGKEQMQKEEVEGPPKELFKKKKSKHDSDSDSDGEIDVKTAAGLEQAAKKLYEEEDGEQDYDVKALRRYQLQRLRYYYAIVRCDSIATAKSIYDNCDGTEYESTANIFDLRYVPEDMDFDDSEARDSCTKLPNNYRPAAFVTDALQHSKVKLTWDETPRERLAVASRQFSQKEIEEMDFKAYLASDSDSGDEDQTAKDKYKLLLGNKMFGSKADDDEDEVDMEISFNPGLDDKTQEKEPEEIDSLTAYKLKQKERRKARMEKFKERQKQEKTVEEPAKIKKDNKSKKPVENDTKSAAELELLMMDDNDDDNHFNMKDVIKAEKKKNKKQKKKSQDLESQDNFEVDLKDDRFKEIFEDRDYNIDPTNTDFKKTQTMKKILDERSKRQAHGDGNKKTKKPKISTEESVKSLAEKVKRKNRH